MSSDILVLGYGNPGRGDDALGPMLIEKLDCAERTKHESLACFQLQPEQIFDLENRRLILFADASVSASAPFSFTELTANCEISYSTHSMTPETLLYIYETLFRRPPPCCFLLSIRGNNFKLGKKLSDVAEKHLDAAFDFATELLDEPDLLRWRGKLMMSASIPAPQSKPSGSPPESSR